MTREEAKALLGRTALLMFEHNGSSTLDGDKTLHIIDKIFDEHEAQMKAKDEEIVELKLEVLSSFPKIANTKARKIIAMLFWKAKRQKKVFQRYYKEYGRNHSLTQNYRGMYEQAIVDFTKSYKILKDKQ